MAAWLDFALSRKGNVFRSLWERLSRIPGGSQVFDGVIARAIPYTGSVRPHVEELRQGYARVSMRDRRAVRNHLDCIHAVALANLAEYTGNLALAFSLPDDARFIVAGMSVRYLKKARGRVTGTCTSPEIADSLEREYDVLVELRDRQGDLVADATLRTLVGPKRAR